MVKAMAIADYIINKANVLYRKNPTKYYPVSNLYLQKLMYFINVIHMVYKNKKMINNDFEKWALGPVIPSVYREYKSFGGQLIFHPVKHISRLFNDKGIFDPSYSKPLKVDSKYNKFINRYIEILLQYRPSYLVSLSHDEPQWVNWRKTEKRNVKYNNNESKKYWNCHRFWENKR